MSLNTISGFPPILSGAGTAGRGCTRLAAFFTRARRGDRMCGVETLDYQNPPPKRTAIWPGFAIGIVFVILGIAEVSGGHSTGHVWQGNVFGSATIIAGVVTFVLAYRQAKN